jgi:hypothetical protein
MQFLAPLFLAALAALAVPILLHVRRQQPREKVAFSAVQFLDTAQPLKRRRLRLQDILLLLLRCLAFALLAFAFARPFFGSSSQLAKSPAVQRLILLDTSASMRGERFARAQKEAERIVDAAGPDDLVAIGGFDRSLSIALSFPQWRELPATERRSAALVAIRSLQAGWRETDFGSAWTAAADLLDQSRDSNETPGLIHVIGDFQRGAATGELIGFEWPARIQVVPVPIQNGAWTNAGIHPAQKGKNAIEARIVNSAGSEYSAFRIAWKNGSSQPLEIAPGQSRNVTVPDSSVATLGGDTFDFDNTAWFAPLASLAVTVDYLGAAKPDDTTDSLFFLSRALSSTASSKIDLRVNPSPSAAPPVFSIVDGALEASAATRLRARLEAGGAALLVLRDPAAPLAALAGGHPDITEASVENPALFGEINFSDPVFQPFADPKYSNFSRIFTWHYRKLAAGGMPGAKVLAAFDSGDPALLRIPVGRGTLFVLATTWRPADSQLALSSKFAPLLHSLLAQASGFARAETNVSIGDIVTLPPQAETRVITPSGAVVSAPEGKFGATDAPGIYRTTDKRFTFAVNPAPSESELTPLTDTELKSLGVPLEKISATVSDVTLRRAMAQEELERRQKWWWWLILSAIGVFIMESALAAWSSHQRTHAATA